MTKETIDIKPKYLLLGLFVITVLSLALLALNAFDKNKKLESFKASFEKVSKAEGLVLLRNTAEAFHPADSTSLNGIKDHMQMLKSELEPQGYMTYIVIYGGKYYRIENFTSLNCNQSTLNPSSLSRTERDIIQYQEDNDRIDFKQLYSLAENSYGYLLLLKAGNGYLSISYNYN